MTIQPTAEQLAILAAVRGSDKSLLINALAGAAKTSTLVLIAKKLPLIPTICVAFNKRIADEMKARLPGHVESMTLNSLGHRVWGAKLSRRLIVEKDKMYDIFKLIGDAVPGPEKAAFGEMFASLLRASRTAKAAGYIPLEFDSEKASLFSQKELAVYLAASIDCNPDYAFMAILDQALGVSIGKAFGGVIDFDDQIYCSTLFGGQYPTYPIVMVDEAQDLSPLNHASLRLLLKPGGRLIAVGDPWQSIYAFRGAKIGSMDALREEFAMEEMNLSVSFRCPKAVVRRAHSRVPHMQWPEWAIEGEVASLPRGAYPDEGDHSLEPSLFPEGSAIICRNNAPLFRAAMWLIRNGRSIKLWKADIGVGLVKTMVKLGEGNISSSVALVALKLWRDTEITKAVEARHAAIYDRYECMKVFLEASGTLSEAIERAKHLFSQSGKIDLLTGHGAKGHEWDTVFHLNPFLVPSKWARRAAEEGDSAAMEQELNLKYVIETRSKKELFLISTEDMQ